jgi:hypothetical protein
LKNNGNGHGDVVMAGQMDKALSSAKNAQQAKRMKI